MLTRYLPGCHCCARLSMYRYSRPSPVPSPLVCFGSLYRANLQQWQTNFVFLTNHSISMHRSISSPPWACKDQGDHRDACTGTPVLTLWSQQHRVPVGTFSLLLWRGLASTKLPLLWPHCCQYPRITSLISLIAPTSLLWLKCECEHLNTTLSCIFVGFSPSAQRMRLNELCLSFQWLNCELSIREMKQGKLCRDAHCGDILWCPMQPPNPCCLLLAFVNRKRLSLNFRSQTQSAILLVNMDNSYQQFLILYK